MGRSEIALQAGLVLIALLPVVSAAGSLTAADWDDNNNYWHFEEYAEDIYQTYSIGEIPLVELSDRVSFFVSDRNGDGLPNPHLVITPDGEEEPILDTYGCYDGWFRFFPEIDGDGEVFEKYTVRISPSENDEIAKTIELDMNDLNDKRIVDVQFEDHIYQPPGALDLAFVVDTTGSMGDELNYLKYEFQNIVSGVQQRFQVDSMRFGLVVYRDEMDEYVTRSYDFTESIQEMQGWLDEQESNGGDDYEEAVEKGLREGVDLDWRDGNTARMMFHVADAPPHSYHMEETVDQVLRARDKGIHIYPMASSGIEDIAEFTMRLSEVLSHGRYLFLTDDSGIGNSHAEPHIPAYVVTTMEDLLIRLVESELRGKTVQPEENEIIRVVGDYQEGVVPEPVIKDNETQDDVDDGNETSNVTTSDPVDGDDGIIYDPSTDGHIVPDPAFDYDYDYDDDEGRYDLYEDPYAGSYDDDEYYSSGDSEAYNSPGLSIWMTILGIAGLLLVLSAFGRKKLTYRKR